MSQYLFLTGKGVFVVVSFCSSISQRFNTDLPVWPCPLIEFHPTKLFKRRGCKEGRALLNS